MKQVYTLIALLLMSVSALAQNGRQIYNKYSDLPDMQAVYVSPAMFRLIGRIPDIETQGGDVNLSSVIKSMTGFYLLSTENARTAASLKTDVDKFVKSGHYELLMEAKEKGEVVRMYTIGDDKTVTSFVMLAQEDDEITFISLDGNMDRAQMEDLIAKAAAD